MKSCWGTIGFEQFKVQCIIGAYGHERKQVQEIRVDLGVEIDFASAAASDALADALNYVQLAEVCERIAVEGQYHLLEAYAAAVMDELFATYPIRRAKIRVRKAKAIAAAECAFVELEQVRK